MRISRRVVIALVIVSLLGLPAGAGAARGPRLASWEAGAETAPRVTSWGAGAETALRVASPGAGAETAPQVTGPGTGAETGSRLAKPEAEGAAPDASVEGQAPASQAGPLAIPVGRAPTKLDGQCPSVLPDAEWGDALVRTYNEAPGVTGTVLLKHDADYLYVCLQCARGQSPARFASVYLDTDDAREATSGATDYGLRAAIVSGDLSSVAGTGGGGYAPTTLNGWTAATWAGVGAPYEGAEYRIPLALTGGACGNPFGLAVYHHWVLGSGASDYGWPSNQWYDQPQTWQQVQLAGVTCSQGNILYIYRRDSATAADLTGLLEGAGYTVDTIPVSAIAATNVSPYDLIIVADDTGSLDTWAGTAADVAALTAAAKPIMGLGEGGYAFFGRVNSPIGWPHGWHGPQDKVLGSGLVPTYYQSPHDLSALLPGPFALYAEPTNEVGIYMRAAPASVTPIGWEPPSTPNGAADHASLTLDGCYHLWGYSGGPTAMNSVGRELFINAAQYMRTFQCPPPPPTRPSCVTLTKSAAPPDGSAVQPGETILYTLAYTVSRDTACASQRALLLDKLPDNTLFVPGSAGGVEPNFDNMLLWDAGVLTPGATGSKSFKVTALDTACRPGVITNTAKLQTSLGTFTSNTTTHKLVCPPVVPPNREPPYAESEIQVYPYPLVTGRVTQLSVRVYNTSASAQTATVTFQTSPERFGIGIPFGTLPVPGNPRVVTLGPLGYAEVLLNWTPVSSGHYCIQVKIEGAGYAPIYTQRNLDVSEDLRPGVEDVLAFTVGNPSAAPATIDLVVVNTCPGWAAFVTPSALTLGAGMTGTATLHVTPPNPAVLGTACHIDVQGWIGERLIGGLRKLDVPPVQLPPSDPPWLEKEISTVPTTPVSGTVNRVCIELQNPLPVARYVMVRFSEAVFGAGIPFTPFATQSFTLPPLSLAKYCTHWTPLPSASLHRCLLVELGQAGWQTQRSQRNIDIVSRGPLFDPGSVRVPFGVGNPFRYPGKVRLEGMLVGLNAWRPKFTPDPPPEGLDIGVGEIITFTMELAPTSPGAAAQAGELSMAGDVVRADVQVLLNDAPASGFSVEFAAPERVWLPLILMRGGGG